MRQYETTATVRQEVSAILQQYAYILRSMKMMLVMTVIIAGIGIVSGIACMKENAAAGVLCMVLFGFAAVIMMPVGKLSAKRMAANLYPRDEGEWSLVTWFLADGIHTSDDDDEDDVIPLSRIVCGCRTGNVLLLCTDAPSVVPVNLEQLSETDRKSLFDRLKTECPKLKMIQQK